MLLRKCQAQHIPPTTKLSTPEHHIKGCHAIIAPREVALVIEKVQLRLMDAHITVQDLVMKVFNLAIATRKTQIQALVETPHLETPKKSSVQHIQIQNENKKITSP